MKDPWFPVPSVEISVEALVRRIQEIAEQAALEQVRLAGADSAAICCSVFFFKQIPSGKLT